MFKNVEDYRNTLSEIGKTWYDAVVSHMKVHHPEYQLVLSYQRPTYKLIGKIFLMLGGGAQHFSIYTTDFDYVLELKAKNIKGLKFGKSAVLFQFKYPEHLNLAFQMADDVISRVQSGIVL
jgi:uncharacterized protein YdhG (YjbR/CyaY superfamily)